MKLNVYLSALLLAFAHLSYGQIAKDTTSVTRPGTKQDPPKEEKSDQEVSKEEIKKAEAAGEDITFEKPINLFAAAGVSLRISRVYSVAVSPVDQTVQFEEHSPVFSSLTTGIIWNPVRAPFKVWHYEGKTKDWGYEYKRKWYAFALLINVFSLSYSGDQAGGVLPIDVGFGLGYRKESLCILGTLEFTPIRQPRDYFVEQYKGQNKQLLYAGSEGPVPEISEDNNNLFATKLIPAIGIKVAYAFTNNSDKD